MPSTARASVRATITKSASRAGVESGPQLEYHFLAGNDLLALEMAAALGCDLVFQQDAGGPGPLELAHGADDIVQIAVAGIAVGHHRNGTRWAMRRTASAISVSVRKPTSASPSMLAEVPNPPIKTVSSPAASISRAVKTSCAPRLRMIPGPLNNSRNCRVGSILSLAFRFHFWVKLG